ncbi:uncharacterized protein LOC107038092 [Diachasma alloeum]|uniref:uncharacterized protein LOC107038092 n=1 Tax=Diachasma alloeum TaxID=454923 RepID=UPI000738180B|nr:uncharacterized protein LOC107038092 [Diachasma alloeum]
MDAVKDCIECINPHWIAMVGAGMYAHIRQICIIGLCFENENLAPFQPTYASLIFTFSVLSLLAEFKPWPSSLKEPPVQLLYIYEMLVAALVTNLSTRAVWMPMISSLWCLTQESSKFLYWINSYAGLDSYSPVTQVAYYLTKEDAVTHMSLCMSVLSFVWMLDATESLDAILDSWAKVEAKVSRLFRKRLRKRRICFEDPEVTDWFFYDAARHSISRSSTDS